VHKFRLPGLRHRTDNPLADRHDDLVGVARLDHSQHTRLLINYEHRGALHGQ
tara:strand:- start:101 stop:256 length:156 start_codon:yes stop_codon:yes gene_type:complete